MIRSACALLAASLALPAAGAEPASSVAPAVANGEVLAATCSGCHEGEASGDSREIPGLGGLSAEAITGKLLAYRDDKVSGTLMNRLVRGYSEQELRMIAEYLGALKP